MHIRINIPAWGRREIANGLSSFFSGSRYRARLQEELERELHPFKPLLVSSARYAIGLAARMLGLEGRRVAVPGYVCPAVLTGLRAARVEIVAVDCQPSSVQFSADMLARALGDISGVVAPNTYGLDQDFSLLARLSLPVIEDAAYQAGSRDDSARARGARADAGAWSFNFKSLTSVGGGVLIARDNSLAVDQGKHSGRLKEAIRFLNYLARSIARHRIPKFFPGADAPRLEPDSGPREMLKEIIPAPMSELQASVALAQWQSRHSIAEAQKRNSDLLFQAVSRCEAFAPLSRAGETLPHLFPALVRASAKEAPGAVFSARRFLHRLGIQTETPYPVLLGSPSDLPNAHDLASRLILIPCNASIGRRQISVIASGLEEASKEIAREFSSASFVESFLSSVTTT
jgi:dTDP-4-amino-4,6-dideoxygalactose transaminase